MNRTRATEGSGARTPQPALQMPQQALPVNRSGDRAGASADSSVEASSFLSDLIPPIRDFSTFLPTGIF